MPINNDILNFKEFSTWVATLHELDRELWTRPLSKGKWSTSEIISHIMNWDHHILTSILPAVKAGTPIRFPDEDRYNQQASDYARSGIGQSALLEEVIQTREQLVAELLDMPEAYYYKQLNYSLSFLISEFVLHDRHHKEQIESWLRQHQE
ncbi:DinB family protein [Paenibacillus filicis]|uniref:DinB family protein n=1 Tax=Paenibacillus filicis TaxID=669464 RepID=A0ABU9DNR8_9BACL